jgi:hypothetical protein
VQNVNRFLKLISSFPFELVAISNMVKHWVFFPVASKHLLRIWSLLTDCFAQNTVAPQRVGF